MSAAALVRRLAVFLTIWLVTSVAVAQNCALEVEPNDTPSQATRPTGVGQNAAAVQGGDAGTLCLAGELTGGDQDAFLWEVDDALTTQRWVVEVEGATGGLTQVDLFDVEFAENGEDVTRADGLFRFGTDDGSYAVSGTFLVGPGRYVIGVSHASAAGAYVVKLRPESLSELSRPHAEGREFKGPFDVYGALRDGYEVPFSIDEEGAESVWGLALQAPVGMPSTLTLEGPDGEVGSVRTSGSEPVRLSSLGLRPGDYTVRVTPVGADAAGYARVLLERQGRMSDGTEVEPNDGWEDATRLPLGGEIAGIADGTDNYRVDVSAEDAGSAWDLELAAADEMRLRIYGPDGELVQDRRGVSGTSEGLHLVAGTYIFELRGSGDASYTLSLTQGAPAADGFEVEPNDFVRVASALGPEAQARGELGAQDADFYRLEVTGGAQRYRVQVVGEGVTELALFDAGGGRQARAQGERRIRLDDLVLLPGGHFLQVSGSGGEYALRALALGPAPEPAPPEDAPSEDEPLEPAPETVAEDEPVEAAAADPAAAELPSLPPPPPGVQEREPNDDETRAHRLEPGAVHVGRIAAGDDEDHYRFHLSTSQYVRLELVPAGSEDWRLALDGKSYYAIPGASGGRVVAETWLLAGDHSVTLRGAWLPETPSGYYQLRLIPAGTLGLPVDLEPNDSQDAAVRLPHELAWAGRVGEARDIDVYSLPVFEEETVITLNATPDEELRYDLLIGGRGARFDVADEGALSHALPAGEQTYLRVGGRGEYRAEVSFSSPPDPAALLPPREGGELAVELELQADEAAAYWHHGQSVDGTLTVRNGGADDVTASIAAAADSAGVTVEVPASATIAAGDTIELPVTVRLPSDLPDQAPVALEVAVAGGSTTAVGEAGLALRCESPPVDPFAYWSVPDELLGRPNVLFAGFGTVVPEGTQAINRDRFVNDGRTTVSNGGWLAPDHAATFELPGDGPVTLVGTVLNPASDVVPERQLKGFRVETSLDGVTYETALEGELSASKVDQAFVFEEPVEARFARLVGLGSQGSREEGYFGEWKLVAADPALFSGLDLADPALGGHVAWSNPLLGVGDLLDLLGGDGSISRLDLRGHESYSFAVGFENGRAALVDAISLTQADAAPEQLLDVVEVSVSMSGAAGPWQPLTEASLGAAGQVTEIELESPVWARYVRLTFPAPEDGRFYFSPRDLSVFEAPVADGYLSVLSEWGTDTGSGPHEHMVGRVGVALSDDEDAGDAPGEAALLPADESVSGTVAVAEDVDWYRITVPAGENRLEVRLTGEPSIDYRYELLTAEGAALPVEERTEGDEVVLGAYVEPGEYLLKLEEPKRTVIFAWDTSGSVSPYQPITYSSLASFARGVDGERESVQLLAFNEPRPRWLLPIWSSDTERVQRAITEWDRNADSSNSELALYNATSALRGRDGTKAILFMTDAETGGHDLTPQLWSALEEVRPRVFTFEISSGGNAYPQQLMQSWAAVNAGVYDMASGVGDFDAGFARASCLLRRPKRYTVTVTTAAVAPPGPGTLTVVPSPTAGRGGVHVIFDASGSMGQALPSGEQRITAAKRALEDLVGSALDDGTPFSLRAFGHVAPNSCETRLDVALGPLDREAALSAVRAIEPKLLSQTAIADSLLLAVDDLAGATGPRTVILITDGEESCGGDPATAAAELRAAGDTTIAIVSLALDAEGLAVFNALADDIGASYVDVGSFEGLQEAIAAVLKPGFEVYDEAGGLVATGRVGDSVELPMGIYEVRVMTSPTEVFESVTVPGDGRVEVVAGAR